MLVCFLFRTILNGELICRCCFKICFQICHLGGQRKPGGLKLIRTYQILVYSDDVNLPGQDINIINKNTEGLFVTSK